MLYTYLAQRGRLLFERSDFPEAWAFFDSKDVTFLPDPMTPKNYEKDLECLLKSSSQCQRRSFERCVNSWGQLCFRVC